MKKAGKGGRIIPMRFGRVVEMRGALVGRVMGSIAGGFSVDFPGNPHGPTLARSTVPLRELAQACEGGSHPEVLLLLEAERSDRPVILGLIAPWLEKAEPKPEEPRESSVDGWRVVLNSKDELILKCGKALIVMRRNGRIVVRGTHIETALAAHLWSGGRLCLDTEALSTVQRSPLSVARADIAQWPSPAWATERSE